MFGGILAVLVLLFVIWQVIYFVRRKKQRSELLPKTFPPAWTDFLVQRVAFFEGLSAEERKDFEQRILVFLSEVVITPVKTKIDDEDRLLIAASALIPIFYLGESTYPNLREVLVYPNAFDHDHQFRDRKGRIAGMVGNGYMNGTMILSKTSILGGFMNNKDAQNTPIHEFVHLIDAWDGDIDGIPNAILCQTSVIPWVDAIRQGIDDVRKNESSIDDYAGTNSAEFLAVSAEYFFEKPHKLQREHPEIYRLMKKMFRSPVEK